MHQLNVPFFVLLITSYSVFIFLLPYGYDARQKANSTIFLFELKTGCKAAETTGNISSSSDPGTLRMHSGAGWRCFPKERSPWRWRAPWQHQKLTVTKWERPTEPVLLQLQRWSKSSWRASQRPFGIWSKLGKCKSLINSCLMSWVKIKTTVMLNSIFHSYSIQQ